MRTAAWAAFSFSAAVFAAAYLLPTAFLPWAVGFCALASALGFLFRGKIRKKVLLVTFGCLAGLLCCFLQEKLVIAPSEALAEETRTVSMRVCDYPDIYDTGEYVTVRVTEKGLPRVRCRLCSYEEGTLSGLQPGDSFTGEVTFRSAGVRNGEEVDSYRASGIFLRAVCREAPAVTGKWKLSFFLWPQSLNRAMGERCFALFPEDVAPFMKALLTGDKTEFYEDSVRCYALQEAGLSHVVAISGMHISFLVGMLFLVLGRNRTSVWLCCPILLLFAAVTGFTPSVTRAVFMQLCFLIAPVLQRENDPPTALSTALALLLLLNPSAAASVSLQLSFAAMGGIALVSDRLYRSMLERLPKGLPRVIYWFLSGLAGSLSSSVGAMLLTVPLQAIHFGTISLLAPLSNILCLWMVSVVFMGGCGVLLVGSLFPAAGVFAGAILAWGSRYIFAVTLLLRRFPWETVYVGNRIYVLWLAFVYLLFLTAWLTARRSKAHVRPTAPLCLSVCSLCLCLALTELSRTDELRFTALDVGQGQCLVLTAGEASAVVDCGGSFVTHNAGDAAVRFLGGQGRREVDALILTHLHSDHVNGVEELLSRMRVKTLYLPRMEDSPYLPELLSAAERSGTEIYYVTEDIRLSLGGMEIDIYEPRFRKGVTDGNEYGLFVLASQNDFDVLITGDAPAIQEKLFVSRAGLPEIEVLVVGHHGSDTSTSEELLRTAAPDAAVISVGYNTYGHPTEAVLSRLRDCNIPVYRTDEEGNITLAPPRE